MTNSGGNISTANSANKINAINDINCNSATNSA